MRIIPVLDLLAGRVVRGVGGRRHEYQPIASCLTPSCQPIDVARAFRDQFSFTECYLADLDAIAGAEPAWAVYRKIQALGLQLLVDAGVRTPKQAEPLAAAGVAVVVGLETVAGPAVLAELAPRFGPEHVVFSLDLKDGRPLGDTGTWNGSDPWSIAQQALTTGVRRLMVLDLARVGGGAGTGTEDLCRRLSAADPDVEIIAGGGVTGVDDLRRLHDCGVRAGLVASALHDGRLRAEDLARS